jgi:hypothetical protein
MSERAVGNECWRESGLGARFGVDQLRLANQQFVKAFSIIWASLKNKREFGNIFFINLIDQNQT